MNRKKMKYKLVRACFFDLDDILSFEKRVLNDSSEYSSKRSLLNFIKSSNSEFLLIKNNEQICAYAVIVLRHFKNRPSARIYKIAVDKCFRRIGLASKLIGELERFAIENSMTGIYAEVRESNNASLNLFQKYGYKKIRTLFGFYSCLDDSYDLENGIKLFKSIEIRDCWKRERE